MERVEILKKLRDGEYPFFKIKEKYKISCVNIFTNLIGSHCLFEILHTTLIVKNSENMIKSGCFEKPSRWTALKLKKDYKVSHVKMITLWKHIRMTVFIWDIAHFTVKNSENMVKSTCFEKSLQWRNEEGI